MPGYLPANHGLLTFHLGDEPFTVISQAPLHALPSELITNDLANPANTYQAAMLHKQGIRPAMEMDSYTAAAQLALGGMLPALVPRSIVSTLKIEPQHCFDFAELADLTRPIHICLRASRYRSSRVQALITALHDAVPKAVLAPSA